MMRSTALTLTLILALCTGVAAADEVSIRQVVLTFEDRAWRADVTLAHADSGWDHYADAWRVVDGAGTVLGTRELWHPHVDEQPFTRSLTGLEIPSSIRTVYIEAHDKVHGWSADRVAIDLLEDSGERYRIHR